MLHIKFTETELEIFLNQDKIEKLPENKAIDKLIITHFNENKDFSRMMTRLINNKIKSTRIIFQENKFGGNVYCDSLLNFIKFSRETLKSIEIEDIDNCMSNSDYARLRPFARTISITLPDNSILTYQPIDDSDIRYGKRKHDFNVERNKTSYFFESKEKNESFQANILKNFFSTYHQQRTDVTCGAACVVMIIGYYHSLYDGMTKSKNPLLNIDSSFQTIPKESYLASAFDTNQDGTDVDTMANALAQQGMHATFSMGIISKEDKQMREDLKKLLDSFKKLFNVGIPVIVNYLLKMGTNEEEGHFSVMIGIENDYVILADPATRYDKKVQHIKMSIGEFIGSWRSETGNIPGKYFILFPNETIKTQLLPELQLELLTSNSPVL